MKELEPRYHAKIMSLPTNEKECFALLHLGTNEGEEQFASFLGLAIKKVDEDGVYYMVLDDAELPPDYTDEFPVVMMAFHEDVIEDSNIPWEIFRDKMNGKFNNKEHV